MAFRSAPLCMLVLVLMAGAGCAPTPSTPPRLIASWPSARGHLPLAPVTLSLTFNRVLRADESWAAILNEVDGAPLAAEVSSRGRQLDVLVTRAEAGAYRLHWHAVSARTGAASDGEQALLFAGESERPARVDLSASSVDAGQTVEAKGSGFAPSSSLRLLIGDERREVKTLRTDARGGFQEDARIPSDTAYGMQALLAVDSAGTEAATAVQVHWGGWPPLLAYTVGFPGPDTGEVTFSLSMRNRSDYFLEKIRVLLDDPDGATLVGTEPPARHEQGAVVWDVGSLDRAIAGPYRATYRVSRPVASHARIEFRHRKPRACSDEECLSVFISETTSQSTLVEPAD